MNTVLMWIGVLLVAIFGAAFAVPHFVDWNGYRGVFEEEASRILGRRVRVGGEVNVRLLPAPYVRFEQIRIADTSGLSGAPFFRTENFTMWLSVPPLLKGVLEAHKIELVEPKLRLVLDEEGRGNWTSLSIVPGSLPFVPAGVALQSVQIVNGVVSVEKLNDNELARLSGINGELVADALQGPYAFRGTVEWGGVKRDLRLATGTPDQQGALRIKARLKAPESDVATSANSYVIDGKLADLANQPRFAGEVNAKVALAAPAPGPDGKSAIKPPQLEVRAKLQGDAGAASFTDIVAAFESDGQPQLIVGQAKSQWGDTRNFSLNLSSRWLDLDKIYSSATSAAAPMLAARRILEAVAGLLPEELPTTANFEVDQVNLGNDAVSNINIELVRDQGALQLRSLRADLPSGGRLELSGRLSTATKTATPAFDGNVFVSGPNLERLLIWGFGKAKTGDPIMNGPFQVQGDIAFADSRMEFTNASGDISSLPLRGEVRFDGGDAGRMAIVLAGHEIDTGWLGDVTVNESGVAGWLSHFTGAMERKAAPPAEGGAASDSEAASAPSPNLLSGLSDLQLRLKAGRLKIAGRTLREVDADIGLRADAVQVPALQFNTAEGLSVEVDGALETATGRPRGRLNWTVEAQSPEGLSPLFDLVDDTAMRNWLELRRTYLAPSRIAGFIAYGESTQGDIVVSLDGVVRDGRVSAHARIDDVDTLLHKTAMGSEKVPENWRARPLDLTLSLENPDAAELVDLAFGSKVQRRPRVKQPRPGRAQLKAVGKPISGMRAIAAIEAADLYLGYGGRIELPKSGAPQLDGTFKIEAAEGLEVLRPAGFPIAGAASGNPLQGDVAVLADGKTLILKPDAIQAGGTTLSGILTLARSEGQETTLSGELRVDTVTVPGLLQLVSKPSLGLESDPENAEIETAWPEAAFDPRAFGTVTGNFDLLFSQLQLADGLAVRDGRLTLALKDDGIDVHGLEGKALGGSARTDLALVKAPAGMRLAGRIVIRDAKLQSLLATRQPGSAQAQGPSALASGPFGLEVVFEGQALGPAALVSGLRGKGEFRLGDSALRGMTPVAIRDIAGQILTRDGALSDQPIEETLRAAISSGGLNLKQRILGVEIVNGAARVEAFELADKAGTTRVTTTVDLATLKVDSEWRINAKSPSLPDAPKTFRKKLPQVRVAFVGPLAETGSLEPRIDADLFTRELSVTKMEYDVIKLEYLRKQDEERARAAAERRRQEQLSPPPLPPSPSIFPEEASPR